MPTDGTLESLVGFGSALRTAGLAVGPAEHLAFCRAVVALDAVGSERIDLDGLYWAGRCCYVRHQPDLDVFDRVFEAYFADDAAAERNRLTVSGRLPAQRRRTAAGEQRVPPSGSVPQHRPRRREVDDGMAASSAEALRSKDFAACTAGELAEIRRLLQELSLATPMRRSRRTQPSMRGHRPDLHHALRQSARDLTQPVRLRWRRPRMKPRARVLLLDVSGSMSAYSRVLLQFAWSTRRSGRGVEVFCFGTRLTRITRALASRAPDDALAAAAASVVDWDGGTRIGESVRTYLRDHARRAGCRGAVVVICSDGLERDDPAVLGQQLARLRRLSHRVIWLNPLTADPRFEPLTGGMTAALPHLDAFVPGHSLESLHELSRVVSEMN